MKNLAKYFYRPGLWWWVTWSLVYRWLFQRKYRKIPLYAKVSVTRLEELLKLLTWKQDTVRELWDSCGSPQWVQYCVDELVAGRPQPEGALDCDDHSVWAANVVDDVYRPELLTLLWQNADGSLGGHCVCVCHVFFGADEKMFYIGNWPRSQNFDYMQDLCADMLKKVGSTKPVGWARLSKDMLVISWGTGLPNLTEH